MPAEDTVYIVGAARTPIGSFQGALASLSAPQLGAVAIQQALSRAGVSPDRIDEGLLGCVLTAGIGQAPARQAMIAAGIPHGAGATTVGKVCGSGLKAVMLGSQSIRLGESQLVVAGGMESMSQAPYLLPQARTGFRMGHATAVDSMIHDGLWDPYHDFHMGTAAEQCVARYQFSRQAQDEFARTSYQRARQAVESGAFQAEIAPVSIPQRKGDPLVVAQDEEPFKADIDKLPKLNPAFDKKEGTITAGNASSINDGAAAVVLASAQAVQTHGLKPLAKILGYATHSQEPAWFTTAPVGAMQKALDKTGLTVGDIDLFEINEAFAAVTLAAMHDLAIAHDKVNIRGGAVALGHPIGASGARLLVTLVHALADRKQARGMASLCIGGGEAVALIVERVES